MNVRPLIALPLALLAFGCGGDDEADDTAPLPLPDLSVPRTDTAPTETETVPDTDTAPADDELPAPTTPETPTDSPENDTPPPQDTPAERFEEFCDENPGACG